MSPERLLAYLMVVVMVGGGVATIVFAILGSGIPGPQDNWGEAAVGSGIGTGLAAYVLGALLDS